MASPPGLGAHRAVSSSSSRGALSPFPAAAHFPSRAAAPFLRQHHDSDGGASVDEFDEDDEEEEEDAEPVDRAAACSSQQRRVSSSEMGRAVMNGKNGARQIQEEQQWQHGHMYSGGTEQYGHASARGDEVTGSIPREMRVEDGYGVIGRREGGPASSYWDLLRAHLSDPLTGILMDDAMILSCGHSYGSSGMQHIYRMKACGKCGHPITEDSIRPNLALHLAVQAFRREEESAKTLKRRRDRLEQDKYGNDDPNPTELSRGKGVQYPFAVFDRVIIKVGKRLRYLTKHPHSDIQVMATDLFGYWKKVVIEETGKKNGTSENERSNNSAARAEKAQPMKVEKNTTSAGVKVEKNTTSASVKVEKKDVDVRGQKPQSVKVEKIAHNESKAQPVKVEKVSKEVDRTPDTKKPSSVPNGALKLTNLVKCNDSTRDKIRELLAEAFSRVSGETSADDREEVRNILDEVDACDPIRVAVTVESAMFERLGRSTGTHKTKYRSILFNLRADNNTDFRRRVLLGEVRPGRLVDISPDEMASDARKQENKQIKEKALFDCERAGAPKATTDQFKCGRCGQRKTTYYQLQTRSADEPMTTFVTCVNCNNHWKFC